MLLPITKTTGTARLAKALAIQTRGLSIGNPVLYGDSYFSSYKPSKLPSVKSYKDFHKTIKLYHSILKTAHISPTSRAQVYHRFFMLYKTQPSLFTLFDNIFIIFEALIGKMSLT